MQLKTKAIKLDLGASMAKFSTPKVRSKNGEMSGVFCLIFVSLFDEEYL